MQSKVQTPKEKLIWMIASGAALLIFVATAAFSTISSASYSSQLDAIHKDETKIQASVDELEAIETTKKQCSVAFGFAEDAYDSYFTAFMDYTDEFQVMLDYGIFAGDMVAMIAIPQIASEGDTALDSAMSSTCG